MPQMFGRDCLADFKKQAVEQNVFLPKLPHIEVIVILLVFLFLHHGGCSLFSLLWRRYNVCLILHKCSRESENTLIIVGMKTKKEVLRIRHAKEGDPYYMRLLVIILILFIIIYLY